MESIVIVASTRTPFGAFNGCFKSVSNIELGKTVVKTVSENIVDKIDTIYIGCVLSAGLGQSPARQIALKAGLKENVKSININKICASGMAALMIARNAILTGESEIAIAGGVESMTNAPYLLEKARFGYRFGDGKIIDHMTNDGLTDAYDKCSMGYHAETAVEHYAFSREDLDKFTEKSFIQARNATENGIFKNEITPVVIQSKKTNDIINSDEIPFSVNLEKMPTLKPAFKENGALTAASASSISDGAAAMLVMKESMANKLGLSPLVRIVAQSSFAQSPKLFATAPIGAIKEVLNKSKWNISDVDLFEINEAFAVVPMAVIKEFSIAPNTVNIFGGACALGHPLGASGARIIVTLINAMKTSGAKKGLAALCVGGGEGVAMTFENI